MSFLSSFDISGSAMSAQRTRMDIIAQNIANAETTTSEDGEPYTRQLVTFEEKVTFKRALSDKRAKYRFGGVTVAKVSKDTVSEYKYVYEPEHPDADEDGYVKYPNVNNAKEQIDLMAATTSYNANAAAFEALKNAAKVALSIGK